MIQLELFPELPLPPEREGITHSYQRRRKTFSKKPLQLALFSNWESNETECCDWQLSRSNNLTPRISRTYEHDQIVAVSKFNIPIGEDASQAKFLDCDIEFVFELREMGMSYQQIANKMDMAKSTVWAIIHGQIRSQIPAKYRRIYKPK